MSYHQTTIMGNLGRDPETRYMPNGDPVVGLSVAVTEKWRDKSSGEKKETTEWYRCVAYRQSAKLIGEYFRKGDPIMLIGRMKTRKWQDQDNATRYSTELNVDRLVFVGNARNAGGTTAPGSAPGGDVRDDDIPF